MRMLALILGALGGLCGVMGIITITGVVELLGAEYTWEFWFMVAGLLLLGAIVCSLGGHGKYE
jgi:hypothetical protein